MKNWKAFFIDVDNTLLDFEAYVKNAIRDGFGQFGIHTDCRNPYEVFTEENNKLWRRIEEGSLTFEGLELIRWNIIFDRLGVDFDGPQFERYFRSALDESAVPVAGAEELLHKLHERGIVCVASNGPYYQQTHRLELAGMAPLIDYCFISENMGAAKPSRDFFERAFEVLNEGRQEPVDPSECLMIGDSLTSDIVGGKAMGMDTCYYNHNGTSSGRIHEYAPDFSARSLAEIADWISESR